MIDIIIKAVIGAIFVVVIALLANSKYYFLAGLLPLFPTFAIMSHYLIGTTGTQNKFRDVIIFGMWSLIPYFAYLITVYYLYDKTNIYYTIGGGLLVWLIAALILVYFWNH
jgi:membrane protein GlpM